MAWEYTTSAVAATGFFLGGDLNQDEFRKTLNEHGKQGWELVSVFDTNMENGRTRFVIAVFKRPVA